ncbi:MAG: hypothetical protein E7263_05615 [Lachnospiraceae bacterium]|nr:hypothetical protein [Lachnospiraceae bacterium]
MKDNKKSAFWWGGIFLLGVGIWLIGLSVFYLVAYDKVEGELYITKKGYDNEIHVYVTYEYDGKLYEDIGLSSRNLFTMKDGKKYTVYINPDKPEWPKCVDFTFGILSIVFGIGLLKVDAMDKPKNKKYDYAEDTPWLK